MWSVKLIFTRVVLLCTEEWWESQALGAGGWNLCYIGIIERFNSLPWSQTDPELVNSYLIVQYFLHPDRVVVVVQVEDFSASKFGCY